MERLPSPWIHRPAEAHRASRHERILGEQGPLPLSAGADIPPPLSAWWMPAERQARHPSSHWALPWGRLAREEGASSRRDGRRMPILVLPPEAKPCMSHDGGRGTAPCRGEKGGCHARCT
ncbi:hypothetical protein DESPIG_02589 [Desulfovibrio piger ATCC 29098]|uniref:Uncharacterized protein n=1 Tax=Desulfovibrio piger ATCC 29098 TaxID=411464 RepID=B6WWW8_9BACT|nr:hypothetical protein DESPIG_02589 [Desulfovibrio piger ATCC 29098]